MAQTGAKKLIRVGIDVGGTFTHAVAIDAESLELLGKTKVPTSHHASNGVGQGVVESLRLLLDKIAATPQDIVFVAHSTTQATNSLLEGDVERVGIISVGRGRRGRLARSAARLGKIPLSKGRFLETHSFHADLDDAKVQTSLDGFLDSLRTDGIRVLVVSAPFSVEDPSEELAISEYARAKGFLCTATHEVAQLYGVKVRTRTTAINASILPKMMEVADLTARGIRELGVQAPLMIMRSDGGVMSIDEMRRKPILTLLSGPAAGIAAALRYLRITDGVFLEVGGTSTDISIIRNGRAITRSASIGGNRTFLRTLDCRTLGIGGGSIPRAPGSKVDEVGPRSAHIARVRYAAFEDVGSTALKAERVQPKSGDPADYLIFASPASGGGELRVGFTPTCASNALGLVPQGDPARAGAHFPADWDARLKAAGLGGLETFSKSVLDSACSRVADTVRDLLREYRMRPEWVTLVGGGGGASAIVPYLAQRMEMKHEIARDSDVISAIGVALGMIREVVERSCINPTRDDIFRIRQEAREKVASQGADPATIEVFLEVDAKKNLLRAEAQGSIEFQRAAGAQTMGMREVLSEAALSKAASEAVGRPGAHVVSAAKTSSLVAFSLESETSRMFGLSKGKERSVAVLDRRGVARLRVPGGSLLESRAGSAVSDLQRDIDKYSTYGDGGLTYPYVYVLVGDRIVDLTKLSRPEHFTGVLEMELAEVPATEPVVVLFSEHTAEE